MANPLTPPTPEPVAKPAGPSMSQLIGNARDDSDPMAPQREAAFFYGLFLRGHDLEDLRQDIDIPRPMLDKWLKAKDFEASFLENLQKVYAYRKQVLAVFDALVNNEVNRARLQ